METANVSRLKHLPRLILLEEDAIWLLVHRLKQETINQAEYSSLSAYLHIRLGTPAPSFLPATNAMCFHNEWENNERSANHAPGYTGL